MNELFDSRLGYSFRNPSLLQLALTHPSARNELELEDDNQRLEYLGDAALGLAAADYLYIQHTDLPEGQLTIQRSLVTSTDALAEIARNLGIGPTLILGRGEEHSGGRDKSNNLADTMEAIIGAAYLDGGMDAVHTIFRHVIAPMIELQIPSTTITNYKGALQEWAQKQGLPCPTYQLTSSSGPAHQRTFIIKVVIDEKHEASAEGASKRAAEQAAAKQLLIVLGAT